jgi:hypothetical protein
MRDIRNAFAALAVATAALSAHAAEVFAVASSSDGARVVLYASEGPCLGNARLAEHFGPDGEKTPGCWVLTATHVLVSFLDGDRGNIPLAAVKRVVDL